MNPTVQNETQCRIVDVRLHHGRLMEVEPSISREAPGLYAGTEVDLPGGVHISFRPGGGMQGCDRRA